MTRNKSPSFPPRCLPFILKTFSYGMSKVDRGMGILVGMRNKISWHVYNKMQVCPKICWRCHPCETPCSLGSSAPRGATGLLTMHKNGWLSWQGVRRHQLGQFLRPAGSYKKLHRIHQKEDIQAQFDKILVDHFVWEFFGNSSPFTRRRRPRHWMLCSSVRQAQRDEMVTNFIQSGEFSYSESRRVAQK